MAKERGKFSSASVSLFFWGGRVVFSGVPLRKVELFLETESDRSYVNVCKMWVLLETQYV